MRTRRKGRWLPRQPRLGARMCQGTFFFTILQWLFYIVHELMFVLQRKSFYLVSYFFRTVLQKDDIMSESESTCLHD